MRCAHRWTPRPSLCSLLTHLLAAVVLLSAGLVSLASSDSTAQAQEANGTVVISSQPEGARIIVNGRRVGVTPFDLSMAGGSTLELTVELDGYQPFETSVEVKAGVEEKIHATLVPVGEGDATKDKE